MKKYIDKLIDLKIFFPTVLAFGVAYLAFIASQKEPSISLTTFSIILLFVLALYIILAIFAMLYEFYSSTTSRKEIKKKIANNIKTSKGFDKTTAILENCILEDAFQFLALYKYDNSNIEDISHVFYHHNLALEFIKDFKIKSDILIKNSIELNKNLQTVAPGTLLRLLFDPKNFGGVVLGNLHLDEQYYVVGLTTDQKNVNECSIKMGKIINDIRKEQFNQEPIEHL